MPIELAVVKTPGGHEVLRSVSHGCIGREDLAGLLDKMKPGAEHHGRPLLSIIPRDSELTQDARALLKGSPVAGTADRPFVAAIVIYSTLMRGVVGFILKVASLSGGSQPSSTRTFTDEADALAWLDGELGRRPAA